MRNSELKKLIAPRSLSLRELLTGRSFTSPILDALTNLEKINLYLDQEDYPYLIDAVIKICNTLYSAETDQEIISLYDDLFWKWIEKLNPDERASFLESYHDICEKNLPVESPLLAKAALASSSIYLKMKSNEFFTKLCRAKALFEIQSKIHVDYVVILNQLSVFLKNPNLQKKMALCALSFEQSIFGEDAIDLVPTYLNLRNISETLHKLDEAQQYLLQAFRIAKQHNATGHLEEIKKVMGEAYDPDLEVSEPESTIIYAPPKGGGYVTRFYSRIKKSSTQPSDDQNATLDRSLQS